MESVDSNGACRSGGSHGVVARGVGVVQGSDSRRPDSEDPLVVLFGLDGERLGVLPLSEARSLAEAKQAGLLLIDERADPAVYRIARPLRADLGRRSARGRRWFRTRSVGRERA